LLRKLKIINNTTMKIMTEIEYRDYKREILSKTTGANIHKISNLIGQLYFAVVELDECKEELRINELNIKIEYFKAIIYSKIHKI